MKNKIKSLLILLLSFICIFAFCACNNDPPPDNDGGSDSGTQSGTSSESGSASGSGSSSGSGSASGSGASSGGGTSSDSTQGGTVVPNFSDFDYTITDGKVTITQYIRTKTVVEIPATIENKPVVAIGEDAFENKDHVTNVTIANSITTIGKSAFEDCDNLTSVVFANGSQLETIGEYAFYNCKKLADLTLQSGLKTIGRSAFSYCAFDTMTLPNGVEIINAFAFSDCSKLEYIVIPESVVTIDEFAFFNNPNLTIYCMATSKPASWGDSWNHTALTYWYSETQPTTAGNYWHYVNGEPTVWGVAD
ncbi:MAG: leucine-rich repeat domain-containing protein [Clostridia bacterium]|nr:leucine-rich repeat domain-containing protein [Clostridia bacterium]